MNVFARNFRDIYRRWWLARLVLLAGFTAIAWALVLLWWLVV